MPDFSQAQKLEGILFFQPLDIGNYRDEEGRPLSENKAPESLKQGIPMEFQECPYSGKRFKHPKPMNVSALQQMIRRWPDIVGAFGFLRERYVSREKAGAVTVLDFWKTALAASLTPSYLIFRGEQPFADGNIPAFVAGLYKASLGLYDTAQQMVIRGILTGEYNEHTAITPDAVLAFADDTEIIIGQKEVCAGPPNLIKGAAKAIMDGVPHRSVMVDIIPRPDEFFDYVAQLQKIHLLNFIFPLASHYLTADLFQMGSGRSQFPVALRQGLTDLESGYIEMSRVLKSLGKYVWREFIIKIGDLSKSIDGSGQLARVIRESVNAEERQRHASAICDLIRSAQSAGIRDLGQVELEAVARHLAAHLSLEKEALRLYTQIQSEMNAALGRGPVTRTLTGADISRALGKTLRDVVSEAFSLAVENSPDTTVVRAGPREIVI